MKHHHWPSTTITLTILCVLRTSVIFGQTPVITGFTSLTGKPGDAVGINGSGFATNKDSNIVYFGAARAQVTSAFATYMSVTIPQGAAYQPVSVTVNGLTTYSLQSFLPTFNGIAGGLTAASFDTKVQFKIAGYATSVATGDLDNDGKPDVVTTNHDNKSISILKNNSQYTPNSHPVLAAPINYTLLGQPVNVTISDVDGDGKLDLIVSQEPDIVSILRNTSTPGNISFAPKVDITAQNYTQDVKVADMDGDGKPEIIVTNSLSTTFSIFKNQSVPGHISFASNTDFTTNNLLQGLGVGDFDGDGKIDIAVTSTDANYVSVFKNTSTVGSFSFTGRIDYSVGTEPYQLFIGDIDGDGKADISVTNDASFNVSVLKNTSTNNTISFNDPVNFTAGHAPYGLYFADLNGDSKPDMVAADEGDNEVSVYRNTSIAGAISFDDRATFNCGHGPRGVAAIDMNGDGQPDIITASFYDSAVVVLTNLVSKPPPAPIITSFSPATGPVGTVITINGSNFDTVASKNIISFGAVRVKAIAVSSGTLKVKVPLGTTYQPFTVTANHRVAFSSTPFNVTFPGSAAALLPSFFGTSFSSSSYSTVEGQSLTDVDGDGKIDVLTYDSVAQYGIDVLLNTSTPRKVSFTPPPAFANVVLSANGYPFKSSDLSGDALPDFIVPLQYPNGIAIIQNISTPGHAGLSTDNMPVLNAKNSTVTDVATGDLDGDGLADIVASGWIATGPYGSLQPNLLLLYRNTSNSGTIFFDTAQILTSAYKGYLTAVKIADIDGDNKPDIITVNQQQNKIMVYRNISTPGNLQFEGEKYFKTAGISETNEICIGDFDGDGKTDIATSSHQVHSFSLLIADTLTFFKNTSAPGMFSFDTSVLISAGYPWELEVADIDGDGLPDITRIGTGDSLLHLYKNVTRPGGKISFQQPALYKQTVPTFFPLAGDIDNDGKPDILMDGALVVINRTGEPEVMPSGAHPVTGDVETELIIDSSIQTYNGAPYVQRHYNITPAENAATATATVTLYFSQKDFDNFNAFPNRGPGLPTGPADTAGIANIRIYQYHGFSATSTPGTYTSGGIEINPADSNVVWNKAAQVWEVTFDVNGFSGFFLSSKGHSALPVNLLMFSGSLQNNSVLLQWLTAAQINTSSFQLQRSPDGHSFEAVTNIAAKEGTGRLSYQYLDDGVFNKVTINSAVYYRLKMIDKDGSFSYSGTVRLSKNTENEVIKIYPNPAKDFITISGAINSGYVQLFDIGGRLIKAVPVATNARQTVINISLLPAGNYQLVWSDGKSRHSRIVFIQ